MEEKMYYASKGATFGEEKAQIYGPHLTKIVDENDGVANTQTIVDDAKDKSSPIHDYFQWNNTKAANEHRKYQARKLIQSIEIEVVRNNQPSQIVRAFHFIEKDDGKEIKKGFAKFEIIHKQTNIYNEFVLKAYLRRIGELNNKYRKYKELEPVVIAIEEILEEHIKLLEVV